MKMKTSHVIELASSDEFEPLFLREHADGSRSWSKSFTHALKFETAEEAKAFAAATLADGSSRLASRVASHLYGN